MRQREAKCNRCGRKTPDADTLMGYCIDCYMHGCRRLFAAINDAVDHNALSKEVVEEASLKEISIPGFTPPKSRLH